MRERMPRVTCYTLNPRRFKQYAISCRSREVFAAVCNFVAFKHGMEVMIV